MDFTATSNCYKMSKCSRSLYFSHQRLETVHILALVYRIHFRKHCIDVPWPSESLSVAVNMPWDEGRKGGHRVETEGRFSMGEEIWLNQYFLSAQPSRIPVLWKEGPSTRPPISKRQLQPAAITLQVSANIGSHGQIHEELKHMWNGFRLTAFFPKLAWPVPKRESEITQP